MFFNYLVIKVKSIKYNTMKTKVFLFTLSFLITINNNLIADSPLTSTDISKAYKAKIIKKATLCNGNINNNQILKFLSEKKNNIELKIAVINEIGWDINGKNNSEIYFNYLKKLNDFSSLDDFLNNADAETLICYAYIKSMDDYFHVDEAISISQVAKKRSNNSCCIHMICSLIEAQKAQDIDWCTVYSIMDDVRKNKSLKKDIKPEAVEIIFNYIDLYKDYCK